MDDHDHSNEEKAISALRSLGELLMDEGTGSVDRFAEVSIEMMRGYSKLTAVGMPPNAIALAMLGAAVNLYDMFNLSRQLPDTLRALADHLDSTSEPS